MLRDNCCIEGLVRRRANASMASTAFFFISKRFNEINVGRSLDKLISCLSDNEDRLLRCDLPDVRCSPVNGCLIRLDIYARVDDLGCRFYRT